MYFPRQRKVPIYTPKALEIGAKVRVYVDGTLFTESRFVFQDESGECVLYDYMNSETFIVAGKKIIDHVRGRNITRFEEIETCQELFNNDGVLSYNTETFEEKIEYVRIKAGDKIKVYMNCQYAPYQSEAEVAFCNDEFIIVIADDIPFTFNRIDVTCKRIAHVSTNGIKESCRINEDVFVGTPSEVSKN